MQDYSNTSANALELLQSCTKPSKYRTNLQWSPQMNAMRLHQVNIGSGNGLQAMLSRPLSQCGVTRPQSVEVQ